MRAAVSSVDEENPWPGLESFREEDVRFFRGRAQEGEELFTYVQRERLTVLYGLSGLGKSSLLQAGLFPHARREGLLPVYIRLTHDDRGSSLRLQVFDRIAQEASTHGVDAPVAAPSDTLWEHFHRGDRAYWTEDNRQLTPLLVFDQFEEAFTLGSDSPEQKRRTEEFLEELGDLIEGRPPASVREALSSGSVERGAFAFNRHAYKVLIGIRQDFLAELETLRARVPSVMVNRMPMSPLRGDAALLVTAAGGAALMPLTDDASTQSVGEQIVRRLAGDSADARDLPLADLIVDPALLSLFCRELNERRKAKARRSITPDLLEGSREQILADYYQRSIEDLGLPVRKLVEDQLLTVSGHRNSEALENAIAQPGVSTVAIEKLIGRRILRREERDRRTRIELTHDVLTGVVRQSRDRRRADETAEEEKIRERARTEQLVRQTQRARRVAGALSAGFALVLALAVFTVREARTARIEKGKADLALVKEAAADSAREKEHTDKAREISTRDSMLQNTVDAMLQARDSVRMREQQATVAREIADQYLRMSAQAITRRIATDSAISQTVTRDIARADSLRKDADRVVTQLRTVLIDALCTPPASVIAAPGDTAAVRRLREYIEGRLVDSKSVERLACTRAR